MANNPFFWPRAYGQAALTGELRAMAEDFIVQEQLPFLPSGDGEHDLLHIRKKLVTTQYVQNRLARYAGVGRQAVSYAGLKDRRAVCEQWFTVHTPGKHTDWQTWHCPGIEIQSVNRHHKKLRRGALRENAFTITIRSLNGSRVKAEGVLRLIRSAGVPNYFGDQRFGRHNQNISAAGAMFNGSLRVKQRYLRGIYLSAARSWLFNSILARRIQCGNWCHAIDGDVFMLDGSHSVFSSTSQHESFAEDPWEARCHELDIHPTGALWGEGALMSALRCAALERSCARQFDGLVRGLSKAGLKQERRALRVRVRRLRWQWGVNNALLLRFSLPAGAYATAVLHEILQ